MSQTNKQPTLLPSNCSLFTLFQHSPSQDLSHTCSYHTNFEGHTQVTGFFWGHPRKQSLLDPFLHPWSGTHTCCGQKNVLEATFSGAEPSETSSFHLPSLVASCHALRQSRESSQGSQRTTPDEQMAASANCHLYKRGHLDLQAHSGCL